MAENEKNPPAPKPPEQAPDLATERIWEAPLPTGDPVEFDPEEHEPPLPKEELEELLEDDD